MSKKKVLVTGGAGYIGAHTIIELVQSEYDPIIIDNFSKSDRTLLDGVEKIIGRKLNFFQGNCADKAFLQSIFETHAPISCVMHFAAYKAVGESVREALKYYRNNLESLISLVETMKDFGVKDLIFSSSCTVYGQPDKIPVSEEAPFKKAESPYGATKQMCERILEDAYPSGLRVISLRYFNPIGAHSSSLIGELPVGVPDNLVPYVTQTAIGKREKLVVFGDDYDTPDGSCLRDFIHVVDLATAHVKAMEYLDKQTSAVFYEAFNLGTGVAVSILELIMRFEKVTGVRVNYVIGEKRPGDVVKTYADPTKANKLLGWQSQYTIEDALLHAWKWEQQIAKR